MKTKIIDGKVYGIITCENEFENYLVNVNSCFYKKYKNYQLASNINWNKVCNRIPIKTFDGIFDGNNYKIYNLSLNTKQNDHYVGLFDFVTEATIKNLNLEVDGTIIGKNCIGILVGVSFRSCFININISGTCNIRTENGYNIGLFAGELNESYCNKININIDSCSIHGLYNIGGFVGLSLDSKIKNCVVDGNLSIIGISCNNESKLVKYYSIETLEEFFMVYFEDQFKKDKKLIMYYQMFESKGYDLETFLKLESSKFFEMKIEKEYILLIFNAKEKEAKNKYVRQTFSFAYFSKNIGGFVGNTHLCEFNDSICLVSGSIISEQNVSGFVGITSDSCFTNCCTDIKGSINALDSFGVFCGSSVDEFTYFKNCRMGISLKINEELVNIINYEKYKMICSNQGKTEYIIKFKEYIYPDYIYKLYNIKKILGEDSIVYKLFECILTFKQMKNLLVKDVQVRSENQILYNLKKLFTKKWDNIDSSQKQNLIELGFDREKFYCLEFPKKKWFDLEVNEKFSALKLGFNQKIWDYQFVQEILSFNAKFDYTSKFTIDDNIRNIITFSIDMETLKIPIPTYIRNIVLLEIREDLIELFGTKHVNIYYTDKEKFDFMVIVSSVPSEEDNVVNPLIDEISQKDYIDTSKELHLLVNIKFDYVYDMFKYFSCRFSSFESFIEHLSANIINLRQNEINIKKYKVNEMLKSITFIVNFTVSDDKYQDIHNYGLKKVDKEHIIDLLKKYITETIIFPNNISLECDYGNFEDLEIKYSNFCKPIRYGVCVADNFTVKEIKQTNPKVNRYFNICAKIKFNDNNVPTSFDLLAFIGKELIYRKRVQETLVNNINILKINSTCNEELVLFKLYDNNNNILYDITSSDYRNKTIENIRAVKNKKYGTQNEPIEMLSYGNLPQDIIEGKLDEEYTETDFIPYCIVAQIFFNDRVTTCGDILYVYDENNNIRSVLYPNSSGFVNGTIQSMGKDKELFKLKLYIERLNGHVDILNDQFILENQNNGTFNEPIYFYSYGKEIIDPEEYFTYYYNFKKDEEEDISESHEPLSPEEPIEEEKPKCKPKPSDCKNKFTWNINSNNINKNDNRCINIGCDNFDCNDLKCDDKNIFYNWYVNNGSDCCPKFKYNKNQHKCNHGPVGKKYFLQLYKSLLDKKKLKYNNDISSETCH